MRLLIGFDGSPSSDAAILDLRAAGLPSSADALVVTAGRSLRSAGAFPRVPPVGRSPRATGDETADDVAERGCARLRSTFPGWDVRMAVKEGSPASVIGELADVWRPDLVVVGAHGTSILERFVLGSTSRSVLAEVPCSVRVARGRLGPPPEAVRLVLAFDDSHGAWSAVDAVARREWPRGSVVTLVTAFERLPREGGGDVVGDHVARAREAAAERLERAGVECRLCAEYRDPARAVIDRADEDDADAIFVGSRRSGRLGRLLLGSVASAVASRAHCSVEVVRQRDGS